MDRVTIKDLAADNRSNFATLFANHSQAMAKLFDAMEAKEAKLFDAMEAKEAKLFAAMEAKDVARQSQIQALFNKFHNLEKQFRSVPNAVTAHLDTTIPQVMALVVDRTLPTTAAAVLRVTISPILKMAMTTPSPTPSCWYWRAPSWTLRQIFFDRYEYGLSCAQFVGLRQSSPLGTLFGHPGGLLCLQGST
jgi:hypothetical protein